VAATSHFSSFEAKGTSRRTRASAAFGEFSMVTSLDFEFLDQKMIQADSARLLK
jgi:hypothetical protein